MKNNIEAVTEKEVLKLFEKALASQSGFAQYPSRGFLEHFDSLLVRLLLRLQRKDLTDPKIINMLIAIFKFYINLHLSFWNISLATIEIRKSIFIVSLSVGGGLESAAAF